VRRPVSMRAVTIPRFGDAAFDIVVDPER
jgi:hypothetical protein